MSDRVEVEFEKIRKSFSALRDELARKTHADEILDYIVLLLDIICPTKGREK